MPTPDRTPEGFTLVELLIVISVLLVVMVLVIPVLQHNPQRIDEVTAISSLRTLNDMEGQYSANYPAHGYACSLTALGGKTGGAAPTLDSAQLISADLASGRNAGYIFTLTGCDPNATQHGKYQMTAIPESVGHTGNRGFCTDETMKSVSTRRAAPTAPKSSNSR